MKKGVRFFKRDILGFIDQMGDAQIPANAAYTSFFVILAMFPIIMLLLSLVKLTPISAEDMLLLIDEMSPEVLKPLLQSISQDLFEQTSNAVLGVSTVTLVWSASRSMLGLINGMNEVYRVDETRNYLIKRLIAVFYMVLFVAALAVLMVLNVFWRIVLAMVETSFEISLPNLLTVLRYLLVLVMLTALFMLIYKVFPDRKSGFMCQLPGGLLASLGWIGFTFLFTAYVNNFSNYTILYGSLTTVVLVMLWMYFCMMILFLGGAVNAYLERNQLLIPRLTRKKKKEQG